MFFSLFHHFFSATYQIKVSNVIYTSELYHCPRILFLSSSLWKTRSRRIESDICGVQSSYHMSFCITWHPLVNSKVILKSFKNVGGFGHCTSHITQLQLKACIGHCEAMTQSTPWLAAKLSSHELYLLWPQVSLWITLGKSSCDGWWLPRYII